MAETFTTNCYLEKPEVGASESTWGGFINSDLDVLDAMLGGVLYGLTLSAAGSTATFGVAIGAASGMTLASAYTKTASAWAVGSAAGSLDTGAIANSTWYHVWLIHRVDTNIVDILTSLSATAPTMPANYTRKRRIGSMKTDGSAQWVKFVQVGDEFLWAVPVLDVNISTLDTTPALKTLSVPTNIQVNALMRGGMNHANAGVVILINSPDETSAAVSTGNQTASTPSAASSGQSFAANARTNTSGQIRAVSNSASTTLNLVTYGWLDNRGRV